MIRRERTGKKRRATGAQKQANVMGSGTELPPSGVAVNADTDAAAIAAGVVDRPARARVSRATSARPAVIVRAVVTGRREWKPRSTRAGGSGGGGGGDIPFYIYINICARRDNHLHFLLLFRQNV